jgi:hypothetical protein
MRFSILPIALAATFTAARSWPPIMPEDPSAGIRNVLAHYCIILDTKTYSNLSLVYTQDAFANFMTIGLGLLNGLPAIEAAMNASLYGIPTQHAMTTSYIAEIQNNTATTTT